MLLELYGHLLWRLVSLDHGSHFHLHLLELVHKLVLAAVLNMAHLLANLLLQRSVALRLDSLQLAIDQDEGGLRVFSLNQMGA